VQRADDPAALLDRSPPDRRRRLISPAASRRDGAAEGDVVTAIGTPKTLTRLERLLNADAGAVRDAQPRAREPRLPLN